MADIIEIREITPREKLDATSLYDKVRFERYGHAYIGFVVGKGPTVRSRITVAYSLRDGTSRMAKLKLSDIEPVG